MKIVITSSVPETYYILKVPTLNGMRYFVATLGRKLPSGYSTEEKALSRLQELQKFSRKGLA